MSLLNLIKEAAAAADSETSLESKYPIVLNAIPILSDLKAAKDDTDDTKLIKRVEGWRFQKPTQRSSNQETMTKQKSDLLCLCVKHVSDIQSDDFVSVFKYFLTPPKDWENQANLAIESCSSRRNDKSLLAKEASRVTYALFALYLFASSNLDSLTLSYVLSRLSGTEMLSLIKYMGKWLKKYEKFPQANMCPKAGKKLGLNALSGLVLDEHFSKLVLYTEFQEELRFINGAVMSLASEARLCCSVSM
ncbi:hypothetical protein MKW92_030762 [Papaver armeniacum]|nr:hypothetical protein MKW92_030762 [Papaver armeniacum]